MVARTKWRQHCATCGVQFDAPQTWAYCSKKCENSRRGHAAVEAREDSIDEWLTPLFEERLELRRRLETAMPHERAGLWAQITANEAKEATMREALSNAPAPMAEAKLTKPLLTKDSCAFWLPVLRKELDQFELSLRRSLQRAIALGKRLLEAKEALPHGEFGRLFRDHVSPVEHALQFNRGWAARLMSIASHEVLSNVQSTAHLPPSIETVYVLSKLPAEELRAAIARGDVAPDMKRGDARDLLPDDARADAGEPADIVSSALRPVQRALRAFAKEHGANFVDLKTRLKAMLRAIEAEIVDGPAGGA